MSDTIAAIATAAAPSAIGIIRISGDETLRVVDRVFSAYDKRKAQDFGARRLSYGELKTIAGELIDVCLCTVSYAPHSYTGEDTAEFQCHGSPVALRTALEALFEAGARQALPGEFTKRAFLNGKMDLTQAEAVIDLIDAETTQCALNAAGQISGAITRRTDRIYDLLTDMSSHYHAVLDYPDEDIEPFELSLYRESLSGAINDLEDLISGYSRGRIMKNGISTAIAGAPNAGKSSLLNALLGYDRAIVSDIPGTTRDTIEEKINLDGITLRLIDTAGLHETEDLVEQKGMERSERALQSAELTLAVIDGSKPLTEDDRFFLEATKTCQKRIVILSKADLGVKAELQDAVHISSKNGDGIDDLIKTIKTMFPLGSERPAGEILTNMRQAEAVKLAKQSLEAALSALETGFEPDAVLTSVEDALEHLGSLSGKSITEDITSRIFARFCVGK